MAGRAWTDPGATCRPASAPAGRRCHAEAAARPRKLIETLAEEIAALVLERFAVRAVEVELRKYILPDTAHVAVRIQRSQA